jgi:hypothetical protein
MNQDVSYLLIPFFMETATHKDQGRICNIAGSTVASKTLKTLNTGNF